MMWPWIVSAASIVGAACWCAYCFGFWPSGSVGAAACSAVGGSLGGYGSGLHSTQQQQQGGLQNLAGYGLGNAYQTGLQQQQMFMNIARDQAWMQWQAAQMQNQNHVGASGAASASVSHSMISRDTMAAPKKPLAP